MSWLDDLFGVDDGSQNQNNFNDKDMALEMLISSKSSIIAMAKAVVEAVNPQLRQVVSGELTRSINDFYKLSDLAISRQWNNVYTDPKQQIQNDLNELQNISSGQ